ncbi:flagellar hook-length control protein FliK [Allochromatium palmeri]|nr:flagellar hook-length control protein FliK [Allochromatium palmeri]
MSEPPRLPPSGSGASVASAAASATRAQASTAAALAERLQVGMQVELRPSRSITPELIETQLRPLGSTTTWSQGIQARLTSPMLANSLPAPAVGERSATGGAMPALRAEVVATSPALVLRLISTTADRSTPIPNQTAVAGSREWLGQQFKQHWPESRPLAATLDRILVQLASASTPPITNLTHTDPTNATPIQRAVDSLIGQLATVTELTDPEQLAVAVSRSGLWMEALLAQAAITPTQSNELVLDLKAQLLVLAQRLRLPGAGAPSAPSSAQPTAGQRVDSPVQALQTGAQMERSGASAGAEPRPGATPEPAGPGTSRVAAPESGSPPTSDNAPPEETRTAEQNNSRTASLARDVEGMLKQVVTKQLQSLDSPAGQNQWLLELPFRTPTGLQALEADIRREQARDGSEHETWSMRLRLDLPKLGPLNILLTLRNERLNASLQSADADGAQQIRQHLSELRARLEAREIEIASLHAGHRPLDRPVPPFTDPLVREQA